MGGWNVTIVITSVAFCGGLTGNFKGKVFFVDGARAGPAGTVRLAGRQGMG
jgi:hypothetical protein